MNTRILSCQKKIHFQPLEFSCEKKHFQQTLFLACSIYQATRIPGGVSMLIFYSPSTESAVV